MEQRTALMGCNSRDLYYGIGRPVDAVAARHCAILEMEHDFANPAFVKYGELLGYPSSREIVRGPATLTALYANGMGVETNIGLARFLSSCTARGSWIAQHYPSWSLDPNDLAIEHSELDGGPNFHPCDYAPSTPARYGCQATIESDQYRYEWSDTVRRMATHLPREQHDIFTTLIASSDRYFSMVHEMACIGGTDRTGCYIRATIADQKAFLQSLNQMEMGARVTIAPDRSVFEANPVTHAGQWISYVESMRHGPFQSMVNDMYLHRNAAVAARAQFERDLVTFVTARYPQYSPHQVRRMFRTL